MKDGSRLDHSSPLDLGNSLEFVSLTEPEDWYGTGHKYRSMHARSAHEQLTEPFLRSGLSLARSPFNSIAASALSSDPFLDPNPGRPAGTRFPSHLSNLEYQALSGSLTSVKRKALSEFSRFECA